MQIPKSLPSFKDTPTLFVVLGTQDARLYHAHNNIMEKIDDFKVSKPHYSDREGHFKTRGKGMVMVSGSVYEAKKQVTFHEFLDELVSHLKEAEKSYAPREIYLFVPRHRKNAVLEALPKKISDRIRLIKSGNYYKAHPKELLEMVAKHYAKNS